MEFEYSYGKNLSSQNDLVIADAEGAVSNRYAKLE